MKILITGSNGFIAKNLIAELKNINRDNIELLLYDKSCTEEQLKNYCSVCDVIVHLAGVNRPSNNDEFYTGNRDLTKKIIEFLVLNKNYAKFIMTSSIHATRSDDYGISKLQAENVVIEYGKKYSANTFIYRLPNVFGKWSKPNYNSAIATFCYNISRGIDIEVNDRATNLELLYIDDLVNELIKSIFQNKLNNNDILYISKTYKKTLGEIVDLIYSFKESRLNLSIVNLEDDFVKKLYSSYLSFLDEDNFAYPLKMNIDSRGSFTEIFRTIDKGQFSVNVIKPGIVKGNHWHHTKNEKFIVVKGEGIIRFRDVNGKKIITYNVNSENLTVVDIPVGYTHNIENTSDEDMVVFMWANECFNPENPDTYYEEV